MSEAVESTDPVEHHRLEQQVVEFFADGVRVLGMPRSVGEIYGLLFISTRPLSLDDLVVRLAISKGSASQGLRMLRTLGAVREVPPNGERRTYYEPATDLKRLAGGFIKEQIRPHLDSGKTKLRILSDTVNSLPDPVHRDFARERIDKLETWIGKSARVLPTLQKLLGQ